MICMYVLIQSSDATINKQEVSKYQNDKVFSATEQWLQCISVNNITLAGLPLPIGKNVVSQIGNV